MELPSTIEDLGPLSGPDSAVVDRLLTEVPEAGTRLSKDAGLAAAVVTLIRASRPLAEIMISEPGALDTLAQRHDPPPPWTDRPDTIEALLAWQRLDFLRIAARDLLGLADLVEVTRDLSILAADTLEAAVVLSEAENLAVVGMGKLGAGELNYASDIDLMFVADDADGAAIKAARQVIDIARRCYRVDINLRPEGRDGALVRTVDSYRAYWDRWAEPWEFQALLKASIVAGDRRVGAEFQEAADAAVWGRSFGPDELRSVRALKARNEAATERRRGGDRDLKLGLGGIRDVEFSVQLLQLVHGQADPALRIRPTLGALGELGRAGYIALDDADGLTEAYRFLRRAEHVVQLAEGRQQHVLPDDPTALASVAWAFGYRGTVELSAGEQLDSDRRRFRLQVRSIHERLYFRPLLEAFSEAPGALTPVVAAARLGAFGFTDANRTRSAVRELTSGLNRTSRLMAQMLPLLLDWLSSSPDPDQGLLGLRTLVTDRTRAPRVTAMFRDSPETARRLCILLGTSPWLSTAVAQDPELIARLPTIGTDPILNQEGLTQAAHNAIDWRADAKDRQGALRRWKSSQMVEVAAADILDDASLAVTSTRLAGIATATVDAALATLEPRVPFVVIAAGRLGGRELAYHSDLDLLFVHDVGDSGLDSTSVDEEANRLATGLMRFIAGTTPAARLYAVDADLRPEGRQGPLSRSLAGFARYWQRWSQPWERLAMVRSYPIAGDEDLADRWVELAATHVWEAPFDESQLREIRMVKARMENERIPASEDARFHLKLGRGALADVELCIQLLQLTNGLRAEGVEDALDVIAADGVLDPGDAAILRESYRWCGTVRNRWHLLHNGTHDSLPTDPNALRHLARSLDTTPDRLRDEFLRVTRRARVVVDREFYGET